MPANQHTHDPSACELPCVDVAHFIPCGAAAADGDHRIYRITCLVSLARLVSPHLAPFNVVPLDHPSRCCQRCGTMTSPRRHSRSECPHSDETDTHQAAGLRIENVMTKTGSQCCRLFIMCYLFLPRFIPLLAWRSVQVGSMHVGRAVCDSGFRHILSSSFCFILLVFDSCYLQQSHGGSNSFVSKLPLIHRPE